MASKEMTSTQRKSLRGQAHGLKPVVWIGQHGLTPALIKSIDEALLAHELIKMKFNEFKEEKDELLAQITDQTSSCLAGRIGNIAILYRQHPDPAKRKIKV